MLVLPAAGVAAPPEGSPPEGAPQLVFDPESYDFGLQQANRGGGQATLQLRNDGEVPAPVSSLGIVGPGSGAFWIVGEGTSCYGMNLQPGESCWVQVGFNPYDVVTFTAQLQVASEGATFTADLSGEGGRAILGPVPDPTSFGAVAVGSAGVTKTIDIVNSGNYPGGAFIAVIAGGAIGSFHLLDENCTGVLLSPATSCTLQVSFQPLSTGVKTARLGLFGDQDGGTQVTLTGVGVEPEPTPSAESEPASAGAAAPSSRHRRHLRSYRHRALRRHRAAVSARRALR